VTGPEPPPQVSRPIDEIHAANALSEITNSDTGNAKRFVRLFRDVVRYVPDLKQWYIWSGTHWEPDVADEVFELTERIVDEIRNDALAASDERENGHMSPRERLLQHASRTESETARRRITSTASSNPRIVLRIADMDAGNSLIACPNGTVDLDTGELISANPAHHNTACVRVPYDPLARSPDLDRYLATFMPDEEDQLVLWGVLGTALRGGNAARLLPMFLGPSTSGKSQLIAAIANLLRGYATSINVSVFRGNLDDRPRPDLVKAMYTRIAYATEAARSWELHADQVKRLTGGDIILYRNLYKEAVEAEPRFTPFIVANEMPRVKGADDAFRRRMLVVRFDRPLGVGREDTRVRERFVSDRTCLQSLFARMVEGARSPAFVNGVQLDLLPDRFLLAKMDAFDEVDHVGSFLLWMAEQGHLAQAEVHDAVSRCAKASDLHTWYGYWIRKHGDRSDREGQLNLRDFGQALRTRGWESGTSAGVRWLGWRLTTEPGWM
jgi:putative DNA primase/helicase